MNALSERGIERCSRREAKSLVEKLRGEVRRHDYLYYVRGKPEVSDARYDRLFEALRRLEDRSPDLATPDSPTRRVGVEPQEAFGTARHAAPMRSLEATSEAAEVRRFDSRIRGALEAPTYLVQEKFDGASIELVYRDGRLERAATRGNGRQGEDVTENAKTVHSVPLRLRDVERGIPRFLAVRAEVLMKISAFERLNRRLLEGGGEAFANPRNAAAGSLRQLGPDRDLGAISAGARMAGGGDSVP